MAGTCRFCACTDTQACDGGCAWATAARDVCSRCFEGLALVEQLLGALAGAAGGSIVLDDLPLERQRTLVATGRGAIDAVRGGLAQAIQDDEVAATIELSLIGDFLLDRCPDLVGDEDTTSAVVMRLLEPHVGSRILLPGDGR